MNYRVICWPAVSIAVALSFFASCAPELQVQVGGAGGEAASGSGGATSSSGKGGAAGQGGSTAECTSGMTADCGYEGPSGTDGVGTCKGGLKACMIVGMWSACSKSVLPTAEGCEGKEDINCDALAPCSGTPINALSPGAQSSGEDIIVAMSTSNGSNGQDGPIYAAGFRSATSGAPINGHRVLLWKRNANGVIQNWSDQFAFTQANATNGATATGIAVIPTSGEIVVTGIFFGGTLAIGGAYQSSAVSQTSFIARISTTGAVLGATFIGTANGTVEINAVAADDTGTIYIGGSYIGSPQIGAVTLPTAANRDAFIAALSSGGNLNWYQVFSGTGEQRIKAVTIENDVIVATSFSGNMNVQTSSGVKAFDAGAEPDILVSRLGTATGMSTWNTQIQGFDQLDVGGLAVRSSNVALSGVFRGSVSMNGQSFETVDDKDLGDSFIAIFDASNGSYQKHMAIQAMGLQEIRGLAIDVFGDIAIAGQFSNSLPLPTTPLAIAEGVDAFVAKLDSNLTGRWSRKFGASGSQSATVVLIGQTTGHLFAGGGFQGQLTGISPVLTSTGGNDAFMIQLSN